MTRKQMIWEIISNARKSRWKYPPNYEKQPSNCFFFLMLGQTSSNRYEIMVERAVRTRTGIIRLAVTTELEIPVQWVNDIFGEKNTIFIDPNNM